MEFATYALRDLLALHIVSRPSLPFNRYHLQDSSLLTIIHQSCGK